MQQRIDILLDKLTELTKLKDKASLIEIDLMLDYTRVIYADLIEWRNRTNFTTKIPVVDNNNAVHQPGSKPGSTLIQVHEKNNIQSLIGINDKYQFISELFNNDSASYNDAINTVNSLDTASQAIKWIQSTFHWDEENDATQAFYSIIRNHFNEG